MNSFGQIYRLTSFGESHGAAIGGVIDGMPAGVHIDLEEVQRQLDRRRPGQSRITTARDEKDRLEVLSGIFEGVTTGTPIGFIVRNSDQHSSDYENMRDLYRPSHADFTYAHKYGIRDHRGGGRSSARETIARVVAGAFAMQALCRLGITVTAFTSQVGDIRLDVPYSELDFSLTDRFAVRCPDRMTAKRMEQLIMEVKKEGDTVGGVITAVISGAPAGLGQPVFDKLNVTLGAAMLSINAVKGVEFGMGFAGSARRGSEVVDTWRHDPGSGRTYTATNNSGGIQGGISNGMDIVMRVAFKPVATLLREVETIDSAGHAVTLKAKGRHDPCVLPRAVPVVEGMAAMALLDAYLLNKATRL
ncbi:MAG: chorismate synthase [Candidatus Amulumruptor caecigallinarius]|nr:chorismate synthase [Candidatus Amulumruptor caecigallinarius]MCM1396638.1 chorismate synthase [Candidatus Amulumruptor caecigallinarius]MCM1453304.1 chorismate synthase [bacterium]